MAKLNFLLLAGLAAKLAAAKDVYFNWNVTWVNASPDGFERPVIGINGQWPCPQIDVDVGDRLIVDVHNGLGNQSTGVHWHGFHQYSTGAMDGSTGVTQCPIPPGGHMQYHMQVNQTGTYWYHSHNMGQYPDGFRGALIVHDPKPPFQYDDEFTITLSDWHHEQMPDLLARYESQENQAAFGGREPVPNSALINDSTNSKIKVLPNKTYLVHIICLGNWPGHTWVFDGHEMTVVEVDGVYVEPYKVGSKMLRLATGQRYGVLIHTKPDASQNFAIWDTMDINMMFVYEHRDIPANYNPNVTAWLVYDESKPLPPPPVLTEFDFVDDVTLIPTDRQPILQPMHRQIIIDAFSTEIDGVARYTINNKTYIPPKVPTLYTANTVGPEYASDPAVYGQVNPFVVQYGEIVEIVINNHHNNLHPWHLHGHQFQVIQRSEVDGGYFTGHYFQNISHTPVRRDTIMVQNHGHAVIRFRADNPDKFIHARLICKKSTDIILRVWLLHCHIEWHVEAGLVATIIEAPETFPQSQQPPPQSHYDACAAYPQPHRGNAAGKNGTDLSGANTEVPTSDHGALYPEPVDAPAPAASTTSSAPPAPVASSTSSAPPAPAPQQQTPPPAPQQESPAPQQQTPPPGPQQESPAPQQQTPPPYSQPQPENTAAPKPKGHKKPPHQENYPKPDYAALPYHPNSPAAVNPEVVPAPQAQPAAQPAPQAAPVYSVSEPVQVEPEHPVVQEPPHDEPIVAHEHDSKGPWPKPHTDKAHAQIGDGSDGHPPTIADSQDTKGPWPNPHDDKTHAQVPDGPGGKPIIAHNEDNKGPWPNPHTNDQYVQEDGHVIKPSEDNGPNHLPEGYQYWEKYTN